MQIEQVYDEYTMYKHSNIASDQLTFGAEGIGQARTEKILQFINSKLHHQPTAVLDVGSGSGAGLIALSHQFAAAKIYGFEPNDHPVERQSALPENVAEITSCLPPVSRKYDLVTLFHVLEHVEGVADLLRFISSVLTPNGNLLVQVPYPIGNPFDYIVSDHVWHFTKQSLVSMLEKANFTVNYIGNELIEKELTLVATPGKSASASLNLLDEDTANSLAWLVRYKHFLDSVKSTLSRCAIYGTGPSGAWAGQILGDAVVAYIDDDPARVSSTFNGKPVVSPSAIEAGLPVIAPFPDHQFDWITKKNSDLNILER